MTSPIAKYVYVFEEGDASMRDLLGGKGAGLAEMTRAGAPVPPGFTITTEACNLYAEAGEFPPGLWEEIVEGLRAVEAKAGRRFGDPQAPLLLSVRSGAKFSMPGMMDTVLNLGLNDEVCEGLAKIAGSPRFAADAFRRFAQLYGRIVMGVGGEAFEAVLDEVKGHGARQDTDLTADELMAVTARFREIIARTAGTPLPDDPIEQLRGAIAAVFRSWNGRRAVDYRRVNRIPDSLGTAVNVQMMVFGNLDDRSATGVAFSRNPSTGAHEVYGEYLVNAQGEDVVAGVRTPRPISEMAKQFPEVYQQFVAIARQLERHYADMQDMEFTIEQGRLYMLQTRSGKRTGAAAVKVAVEMVAEGLIERATAVSRVDPMALDQLLHPTLEPAARSRARPLTRGLPASPGAATGRVVFDPDEAVERARQAEPVILVRHETSPDDFHGMVAARGVLTARGGMTSHAAVVARGMGKPCVAGAGELSIDSLGGALSVDGVTVAEGEFITLDGSTGEVFIGRIETTDPELGDDFQTLMSWADAFRTVNIRANADTPHDARVARGFGAEGIGLCRTEHMFFEGERIDAVRQMILAETPEDRRAALDRIEPLQREDFAAIFREMDGLPVTIRTLDPPLHEFLPHDEDEIVELAAKLGVAPERLRAKVESLRESNPMLGFRGCRLGLIYPEITEMQARAILEATVECRAEGVTVLPEVMIPLVSTAEELRRQGEIVRRIAHELGVEDVLIGTMIELPRAALVAGSIAAVADFFSFGTNDLTQTTLGISRDDGGRFVPWYVEQRIFADDPFQVLDQEGVGQLIGMAVERGREARPGLKTGACGEHAGDPPSVVFLAGLGLDYVSCSPYRIPLARLAAAHAALQATGGDR